MVSGAQYCAAYIIVDVLCLVLTVIVAGNVTRDSGSETQVRSFYLLLTANLVFVIFDAIWAIVAYSGFVSNNPIFLSIVNCICLTMVSFAGYYWLCYTLARFNHPKIYERKIRMILAVPAAFTPILYIVGSLANQNAIITSGGSATFGTMHLVIDLIPLLYLFVATAVSFYYYQHATTKSQRRTCLTFIIFMIAPIAAGIIDSIIPNLPVAAAGIMISIMFVLMSLQELRISSDSLTGLNNRRRADAYLEERILHVSPEQPLYLFIIDMNHFKSINDTYGHLEGDHALKLMAEALKKTCASLNAFAARWGGDEFLLVCSHGITEPPSEIIKLINSELSHEAEEAHVTYNLTCSVGYAACDSPSEPLNQLISEADKMLYENK